MVVGVAVGGAAAGRGGAGDGHLYVAVVLVVVIFNLVRAWYQIKGLGADAHCWTKKQYPKAIIA